MEDGDPELAPTRKRKFSKREVLALLKERENDLEKVAGEICEELVPFDATIEEELLVNDRLERMAKAAGNVERKVRKLQKANKERKFRHNQEMLEETLVSCSQNSIFQSEDSQSLSQEPQPGESEIITEMESTVFFFRW